MIICVEVTDRLKFQIPKTNGLQAGCFRISHIQTEYLSFPQSVQTRHQAWSKDVIELIQWEISTYCLYNIQYKKFQRILLYSAIFIAYSKSFLNRFYVARIKRHFQQSVISRRCLVATNFISCHIMVTLR